MSRKIARENIFKLVFEFLFSGELNDISLEGALKSMVDDDKEYINSTYRAAISHNADIATLINQHSCDFAYDRIYKIDLAVLIVAVSEIFYAGTPYAVAASEAVELAKKYSTDKSPTFINGVLSGIIADFVASKDS